MTKTTTYTTIKKRAVGVSLEEQVIEELDMRTTKEGRNSLVMTSIKEIKPNRSEFINYVLKQYFLKNKRK